MLEFDKNYTPFFVQVNNKINSMIIDNTLLGCSTKLSSCNHYPYRAFSIIMQLFRNELTRGIFPKRLYDILDVDFNIPNGFYRDLLVGEEDQGKSHYGLTLDVQICDDFPTLVKIDNIKYNHGFKFFQLNRTITLTPEQAFHTFSNILLNDRCYAFNYKYHANELLDYSLEHFTKDFILANEWCRNRHGKAFTVYNQFSFEYLKHIETILQNNSLHPSSLLHNSGATLLGFLKHLPVVENYLRDVISILKNKTLPASLNSQVLYFTLLYCSMDRKDDFVFRFLDDHRVGSAISTSSVTKQEFPISDEMKEF